MHDILPKEESIKKAAVRQPFFIDVARAGDRLPFLRD